MTRIPIPHRRPRTLRERMAARLHAVRHDARRRWRQLRQRRRHRAAHARMQKVFLQLERHHRGQTNAVALRAHHPHLRHTKG